MRHQEDFLPPSPDFLDGLVQIKRPSESDFGHGQEEMIGAMDYIGGSRFTRNSVGLTLVPPQESWALQSRRTVHI